MAPEPIAEWYRITLTTNGTAGQGDLVYLVRREDYYSGRGDELIAEQVSGYEALTAFAEAMAQAITANGGGVLDNVTVKTIEAFVPASMAPVAPVTP